jgi:hypothetical protein
METYPPASLRRKVQAMRELDHVDPISIGDQVRCVDAGQNRGMSTEVLPRLSKLLRPRQLPRHSRGGRVIGADRQRKGRSHQQE